MASYLRVELGDEAKAALEAAGIPFLQEGSIQNLIVREEIEFMASSSSTLEELEDLWHSQGRTPEAIERRKALFPKAMEEQLQCLDDYTLSDESFTELQREILANVRMWIGQRQ